MLTDSERAWLEQRDAIQFALDGYRVPGLDGPYEMQPDYEDAALFEARVAAKLALGCESQTPCNGCWRANWKFCNLRKGYWDCADCFLKTARLIVEEEMDGNNTM